MQFRDLKLDVGLKLGQQSTGDLILLYGSKSAIAEDS